MADRLGAPQALVQLEAVVQEEELEQPGVVRPPPLYSLAVLTGGVCQAAGTSTAGHGRAGAEAPEEELRRKASELRSVGP